MEAVEESHPSPLPPPLPPKSKNMTTFCKNVTVPQQGSETTTLLKISSGNDDGSKSSCLQQVECKSGTNKVNIGYRSSERLITSVEDKNENSSEEIYEKASNGQINFCNERVNSSNVNERLSGVTLDKSIQRKKRTPKIEVRQEDFKTVVKISVKETPTPEDEINMKNENIYENAFRKAATSDIKCTNFVESPDEVLYENVSVSKKTISGENLSNKVQCLVPDEVIYENLNVIVDHQNRGSKKELKGKASYCNVSETDGNQGVYVNEFQFPKYKLSGMKNGKECDKKIEGVVYENVENSCPVYANENFYQNIENNLRKPQNSEEKEGNSKIIECATQGKSSSFVEVTLQKSKSNSTSLNIIEDGSSGDPFDSGTSSDVDSLPTFVQTKKGNVIVTIKNLQGDEVKKEESGHRRAESLTSSGVGVDSEESDDEKSNISCDSLNSSEPYPQSNSEDHGYHTPNSEEKIGSPVDGMVYENLVKNSTTGNNKSRFECEDKTNLIEQVSNNLQKAKDFQINGKIIINQMIEPSDFEEYENIYAFQKKLINAKKKPLPPLPTTIKPLEEEEVEKERDDKQEEKEKNKENKSLPKSLLHDIRSRNVRLSSSFPNGEKKEGIKTFVAQKILNLESNVPRSGATTLKPIQEGGRQGLVIEEKSYQDRKNEAESVKVNKICAMDVDTDQFYKFHLSENFQNDNGNDEETFAGVKDYLSREKSSAITSAKGTIRGVKNRVKAGIATFLQMQENKFNKDRDLGKVVVYTTTMGIVRETYHKCLKVKQILKTLMIKFEERDVFMSSEAQEDIRYRMKCDAILVPQVFVEGQHIGDAETIERLNEMGELRTILKPYKSLEACSTCKVCGGYRLLPCSACKGSKKSIHRNHFTAEFVSLKCMNCDQVGLVKCHAC